MNKFVFLFLLLIEIQANSLENFLLKEEPKKNQKETHSIKFYVIQARKQLHTLEENNVNHNINSSFKDEFKRVQENEAMLNLKSEFNKNKHNNGDSKQNNLTIKATEEIILEHFRTPIKYNKYGLKEKVIISFDINENNIITNIHFIEPSSFSDINELFIESIMQSSQKIATPKQKETKTVYFQFDI